MRTDFWRSGHWPTLVSAFLYFDVSFMVWVALGPLALYIGKSLDLDVATRFALVAVPILSGAVLRIPLGLLADHFGSKRVGQSAQLVVIIAMLLAWLFGFSAPWLAFAFALSLGVAGASFAVALPQVSRWYPPRYQGVVMGIAGAGNMGVVLDALFVPTLAEYYGWQSVFAVFLLPLVLVFAIYSWAVKDAPVPKQTMSLTRYQTMLRDIDTWYFMGFYFISFGGFVGLASTLPLYFSSWFHLNGVSAGLLTAVVVLIGSLARPLGGFLADAIGGVRALTMLFVAIAIGYLIVSGFAAGPVSSDGQPFAFADVPNAAKMAMLTFTLIAFALGMANGAVFQLVPQRFRHEIGAITGLVGAGGGLGGYALAQTLGLSAKWTGSYAFGFVLFAFLAALGTVGLTRVRSRWRTTWGAAVEARI